MVILSCLVAMPNIITHPNKLPIMKNLKLKVMFVNAVILEPGCEAGCVEVCVFRLLMLSLVSDQLYLEGIVFATNDYQMIRNKLSICVLQTNFSINKI